MASRKETSSVALVLFVAVICSVSGQACTIGRNDMSEQDVRTDQRFYLDVNNQATCNGTITNWTVCYYGRSDSGSYWATYAIYRRMGSGEDESYENVSELFRAVRTTLNIADDADGPNQEGFNCYTDLIDTGDLPLTIRAGDIIGACVFDPEDADGFDRRQLNIVGEVPGGRGESLMRNDIKCTMDYIPSSILQTDLRRQNNRRLHIYANVEPETTTTTVTASITTQDNQGSNGTDMASSLEPGAIVGIVIVLLVVLVMGVAVAVVMALFLMRRRKTGPGGKHSTARNDIGMDNLIYGTENDTANNGQIPSLEASTYEVPVSISTSTVTREVKTEPEYEITESTYSVPHIYEYATLGPNEKMDDSSGLYYSPLDEVTISYAKLLEKNKQEDVYGNVEEYLQPASGENELYAQIKACGIKNIPSNLIQINGHLGSGQFGSVEKGLWKDGTTSIPVAVKLLKKGATEMDKVKFLQEAAIMAQFRHPNVVSLYGVVSKTEPLMLVVELIEKGNLREYLHTMRPDPGQLPAAAIPQLLLSFSQQVALGMHYLSAKRFIHRDLAARNILVSQDNICKVADFGMSRDLANDSYYISQGGQIPVKWTAPEAIHYKKYSTASDVWSYGCLLYEIWSLGFKPFEGTMNAKMIELVDSGQRLSPPPGCSRIIYELMIKCWNPVAADRPGFREIFLSLLDTSENVLSISPEALDSHPLAGVIGSPLEVGENMYTDLRDKYLT